MCVDLDMRGQEGMDFFTRRSAIMDYGLSQKQRFEVKIT